MFFSTVVGIRIDYRWKIVRQGFGSETLVSILALFDNMLALELEELFECCLVSSRKRIDGATGFPV